MKVLKTATGKEYPCDFMGIASGYEVLYVKVNMDLDEIMPIFQNPEETETLIWCDEDGTKIRSESGFTVFGGFTIMRGACPIQVRMMRP